MTRLLDVLAALQNDSCLQIFLTTIPGTTIPEGVKEFIGDLAMKTVSWKAATQYQFDLAVAAGSSGPLYEIDAPLIAIPHGAGYNKYLRRDAGTPGRRDAGTPGRRDAGTPGRRDAGTPVSHQEQLEQLADQCPEALPRAVVVGDPCFDRLLASVPWRRHYRAALGLGEGQRLVLATSTWGPSSLLGRRPELFARLLGELPVDEYAVAAVVHPNVWHHHGPWQLRAWLADCRRAGLLLIPPREGWRAALVAADVVIGDHGSVTLYGAALGRPVLLDGFPWDEVDPRTALARMARRAEVIGDGPLAGRIDSVITGHDPKAGRRIAEEAFAFQGRSLEILRAEMYRLMRLDQPSRRVRVTAVPPPVPEPRTWEDAERPALIAAVTIKESAGRAEFVVERVPAEMVDLRSVPLHGGRHLVVDGTETDHRLREIADIVLHRAGSGPEPGDVPTVAEASDGECRVRLPDGGVVRLRATPDVDCGLLASAVHAWSAQGRTIAALPPRLVLRVGRIEVPFSCDVASG
ncbi:hypothetical protein [Spirillospora albida]|uniref:hypothetical protein n=1 Tax=Spirillospora albida TaxID=58123 RepID=UPI0012F88A9A|nr:hypothetical protein [Spirillospora albida]